jgi:two-component system LytT family response regulator
MKALIIDDEPKSRIAIAAMLKKNCPEVEILPEADGVKSGIETIQKYNPDIVFLDIQMRDGNGFELLKEVGDITFKIIFITAYNEFAINAFKYSAVDYLLKPITGKDLSEAVSRAKEIISKEENQLKMNALAVNTQTADRKVVLKTTDSIYVVNLRDIIRCEADGNYTNIYLANGKKIFISKSLKEFDDMFSGTGFFRAHSAHLINVSFLEKVKRSRGGEVVMKDGSVVPVAILRKHDLLKIIDSL